MVLGPDPVGPGTALIGEELGETPGTSSAATPAKVIHGRSLGRIAWTRLKRDKVAMAGGSIVILLILVAIFAPAIVALLGHPPDEFHQDPALLDDYLTADAIAFVEWPGPAAAVIARPAANVELVHAGGDERLITIVRHR